MADEQDRLRRQLGLAPLSTTSTAPVVDERTQRAAMAAASATPVPISTEPKLYYNYYTGEYVDDPSKIKPRTGMGGPESGGAPIQVEASSSSSSDEGYWIHDAAKDTTNPDGTINWNEYWSTDKSRTRVTRVTPQVFGSSSSSSGGGKTVTGTYTDPATGDVYLVYSDGSKVLQAKGTKAADAATAKAAADAAARAGRQSAYDLLFQQFDAYGLGALVSPLKGLIESGISPAEFTIKLRETDAYKKRFAANAQRINKGLRAISEAEYIGLEDQYQDVMRRYGLPASYYARGDMGRQEGFEKFIGGDVSPVELEDRVQTAQRRVLNAAPQVRDALTQFYGAEIGNGDILAYVLDPEKAIENIKRKVTAAEIGAGAMQAGLATGVARAEELQRFGVTGEQARTGYQAIGGFLPRASQLGDIYAKQGEGPFTQTTAEQEVFGTTGAVEAQRKRRKLAELETAQFSGTSGAAQGALARERAGQY
jgi:hypothetical protein